jgi:hypothetical protein
MVPAQDQHGRGRGLQDIRFWNTASAVPWYQCSSTRCCAGIRSMNSSCPSGNSSRVECGDQAVGLVLRGDAVRRIPEFTQLDSGKSMI